MRMVMIKTSSLASSHMEYSPGCSVQSGDPQLRSDPPARARLELGERALESVGLSGELVAQDRPEAHGESVDPCIGD
jgi:hypothetical protein